MKQAIEGFAFHCHHDKLFEYVHDYDERVRFIKNRKPEDERELRLRLFQIIPDVRLPSNLVDTGLAVRETRNSYMNAGDAFNAIASGKTWFTRIKARFLRKKANAVLLAARDAWHKAGCLHASAVFIFDPTALHNELCPDCTWDGSTIFPEKR